MIPSTSETVPRHAAAVTLLTALATPLFKKAMESPEPQADEFWVAWESLKRIAMSIAIQKRIHFSPTDEQEMDLAFGLLDGFCSRDIWREVDEFKKIIAEEKAVAA